MPFVCISLGSNVGDPKKYVSDAMVRLNRIPETQTDKNSSLYLTAPWGVEDQDDYINAIAGIQTKLDAQSLLHELKAIEQEFGRVRAGKWRERTLDLDMICYDDLQINEDGLKLPHPFFSERDFVLVPMAECYPDLVIQGQAVSQWLDSCLVGQGDRPLPVKVV